MKLLAADLTALACLPRSAMGRRTLSAAALGLGLFGWLSWWLAQTLLDHPGLVVGLHRASDGESQRALFAYALSACPAVAAWLGLALAQRQLFAAPELPLWRAAPLPPWRPALQALLRAGFASTLMALAIAGPGAVAVLARGPAPAWAYALVPLAVVAATVPALAALLATQIVLVRFLAGRWLQLLVVAATALASVAFSTWLMLSLFGDANEHARDLVAGARAGDAPPWSVEPGARLLAGAARGDLDLAALRDVALWLLATFSGFRLVGRLHPQACERHLAAGAMRWRRRSRGWPATVVGTVRNKEFAQVAQQPGALVGFLVFAVLVFAMCKRRVLAADVLASPTLPDDVAHWAAMLAWWFLATLLVLHAHMGRLVQWDAANWQLWQHAPAAPAAILRGKLAAIGALLLWPLALVGAAGAVTLDARLPVLLAYAATALGGAGVALGVLTVVGTLPWLARPDDGGGAPAVGRNLAGALTLVAALNVAMLPPLLGWRFVAAHADQHGLDVDAAWGAAPLAVGAALLYGALAAALGAAIGSWNFARLLRPR